MTRVAERKVKRLIRAMAANGYKRGYDWKGYEVYEPVYNKPMIIGGPFVILVSGDNARLAPDDEGREYWDFLTLKEEEEKRAAGKDWLEEK